MKALETNQIMQKARESLANTFPKDEIIEFIRHHASNGEFSCVYQTKKGTTELQRNAWINCLQELGYYVSDMKETHYSIFGKKTVRYGIYISWG